MGPLLERRLWSWLALGALVVANVAAQTQPPRFVDPGRVVDENGQPIANAAVTFVSAPRLGAGSDDDDVVHATSGADGRFRVELQATRSYRAWATQQLADKVLASDLTRVHDASTELRVLAKPALTTRGSLESAADWLELGELKLQFVVAGSGWAVPTVGVAADGSYAVPPLPHADVVVRMFCGDMLVHVWPPLSNHALELPPRAPSPRRMTVSVVDGNGAPVPRALVAMIVPTVLDAGDLLEPSQFDRWPLAEAGDDGLATIVMAYPGPEAFLGNNAALPLRAIAANGAFSEPGVIRSNAVTFKLHDSASLMGSMSHTPAGAGLRLLSPAGAAGPGVLSPSSPVADDSKILLLQDWRMQPQTSPTSGLAWLSGWQPKLADGDAFARVATPQPVLLGTADLAIDTSPSLSMSHGFDCDQIVPVRIQVLDATGGPAVGANVYCVPTIRDTSVDAQFASHQATDSSGRCLFGTVRGPCQVFVENEQQFAFTSIRAPETAAPTTLRLQPFAQMRVRVVGEQGEPIAGALVLGSRVAARPAGQQGNAALQAFAGLVDRVRRPAPTDTDGRTVLRFVPCDGLDRLLTVQARSAVTLRLPMQPSETEVEVRVR